MRFLFCLTISNKLYSFIRTEGRALFSSSPRSVQISVYVWLYLSTPGWCNLTAPYIGIWFMVKRILFSVVFIFANLWIVYHRFWLLPRTGSCSREEVDERSNGKQLNKSKLDTLFFYRVCEISQHFVIPASFVFSIGWLSNCGARFLECDEHCLLLWIIPELFSCIPAGNLCDHWRVWIPSCDWLMYTLKVIDRLWDFLRGSLKDLQSSVMCSTNAFRHILAGNSFMQKPLVASSIPDIHWFVVALDPTYGLKHGNT